MRREFARFLPLLPLDGKGDGAAVALDEARQPLAVLAVEQEHAVAGRQPQDIDEVIGLGAVEVEDGALGQTRAKEQPVGRFQVSGVRCQVSDSGVYWRMWGMRWPRAPFCLAQALRPWVDTWPPGT